MYLHEEPMSEINQKAIEEKRVRHAESIAAMGLVETIGANSFKVSTPSLRGRMSSYFVKNGRCSCLEYEEYSSPGSDFKCEHIIAVDLWLNKESVKVSA